MYNLVCENRVIEYYFQRYTNNVEREKVSKYLMLYVGSHVSINELSLKEATSRENPVNTLYKICIVKECCWYK